jgi:hypothetical protein
MMWLDEAMTRPTSAEVQLVSLKFERDASRRKAVHVWVEEIGMGAGQTLVNPSLTLPGTEVFRDGFGP